MTIFISGIQLAVYPFIMRNLGRANFSRLINNVASASIIVIGCVTVSVALAREFLMEMLVGQAAIEAAKIAVLLIIVSVTTFVSNLVGIGLIIRRKTNLKLILQCMFLFVSCFLVLLFWGKLNIAGLIFIFLISKVIFSAWSGIFHVPTMKYLGIILG